MQKTLFILAFFALLVSCRNRATPEKTQAGLPIDTTSSIKYATGFALKSFEGYKTVTLKNPWPGSKDVFIYALLEEDGKLPENEKFDAVISIPVSRIALTSTTHIPSLEMLGETETLVGFANLNLISSEKIRQRIGNGKITELGKNETINPEVLINLRPDALVGFAVNGNNPAYSTVQKAGIPVLYNSDWTEISPLGKAEWIKFFGALYKKDHLADSIFREIEREYNAAKNRAAATSKIPTVLSGALYRDVWYMPQGGSWGAQFIADAHGRYLWEDEKGTGGLSLNLESVLEKGQDAEFWIGPGQFTSLAEMEKANPVYTHFKAFKQKKIYSYSLKKGATGGVIYFELAPNRPDLVLKDHIQILHPELFPDRELYFFDKLN
jgi:iron complex transport system substrate-binding protein